MTRDDWNRDGEVTTTMAAMNMIEDKTKEQLVHEIEKLHGQIAELTALENERGRGKKTYQENRERLRIVFEYAPDAYYLNDLKGTFIDGNKIAEQLIGYKREELIGKSFLRTNLLPIDQIPKAVSLLAKNALGQATGPDEFTLKRKDGTKVTVEIRTFPVKTHNQTLVLGIARDITERKSIEEALRDSEEKYRLVVENANEAIVVAQDGFLKFFNPKVLDITGFSSEELSSMPFEDLIHPDDRSMVVDRYQRRLQGNDLSHVYSFRIIHKEKNVRWVEINAVLITWMGKPATLSFLTDISDRKRTEEALEASQRFFQSTLDALSANIAILDESGFIIAVNNGWRRFAESNNLSWKTYGVGKNYLEICDSASGDLSEESSQASQGIRNVMSKERDEFYLEYPCHSPHEKRWFLMSVTRFESNGEVRAVIAHEDISERKRAEAALQERATRLELISRVGQQTTAILDLDELLHQATEFIADTFKYYNVIILLAEGSELVLKASTLPSLQSKENRIRLRIGTEGISGWVAGSGEPLIVPDVRQDPRYYASLEMMKTKSEVAVPIQLKGRVSGVLDVQSSEYNAFTQIDIFTLQTLADQIAIAIENARLYEQASQEIAERKLAEVERERLIQELQDALTKVKTLSGLIPICSSCKKIRDDKGYWNQVEAYITEHSNAEFSHGFCPDCIKKLYPDYAQNDEKL